VNRRVESGVRATADIVFGPARVAVFVDGCFWHCCPEHGTQPKRNGLWWSAKLADNVARDRRVDAALAERGWTVLRVWEHEDPEEAAGRIAIALQSTKRRGV
jgi:DNA mismatch endonuclease, patch repair protein